MSTIASELTNLVAQAVQTAGRGHESLALEPCLRTQDTRHGDYQSNYAFRLGRILRCNPRELAEELVGALPSHPMVQRAEVAGPGFINFTLTDTWIAQDLEARVRDERFGAPSPGEGHSLVIDYSSPNIAKRMHVGHLRSTVIGNAADRIHRFLGWNVIADNHVGDWGTQFGKLIVAWHNWRNDDAYNEDPISELQRIYQLFSKKEKEDPSLLEQARDETAKLQAGDEENRRLWENFVAHSMQEFSTIYERLDVHFDVTLGESFYRERLQELVNELLTRKIALEDDGAVIIPFQAEDGKGLAKAPMLVRKSDGAALYGTTDLATVEHRIETWQPTVISYVTDVRQKLHFRQVFAASKKIGAKVEFVHLAFGMLRFAGGAIASTREGQVLNLSDVLDTAAQHARGIVDEKSKHLNDDERASIAEAIGVGAIKYADLSQNPQSDIVFDWDKMLAVEGNTAPYLMYAHARCHSILRKANETGFQPGTLLIEHPRERALALQISQLPEAVLIAASTWRPNLLCEYLFDLASTFSSFYGECRVLSDSVPVATTASRLKLVEATAQALQQGLALLGIRALKRM